MEIAYKSCKFEFDTKQEENGDMTFKGYASIFGNRDSYSDIMVKGAFSKTIKENARRIKVLFNHNWNAPIGLPTKMEEDEKGLYVEAKISNTEKGKEVYTLLQDKVITEMSIGYKTVINEWDRDKKVNYIKEVKLFEFSPVTFAANDKARVTGTKAFDDYLDRINNFDLKNVDQNKIKQAIESLKSLLIEDEPRVSTHEEKEPITIKYDDVLQVIKNL